MHKRHQRTNVPTEIARTIVAIADLGSFTKAGDKLDLSQAAISAQVKRFESIIGASAFERVAGGVKLTERGAIALASARKMLDANDQLVRLGSGSREQVAVRIGLSMTYAERLIAKWRDVRSIVSAAIYFDQAANVQRAFTERTIDVACVIGAFGGAGEPIDHWEEEFVWARGQNFLLSPGAPIPLINWPRSLSNEVAVRALERAGLGYRFSLGSSDFHATTNAVTAGLGLVAIPAPLLSPPLMRATEYYLPALPAMRAGIYVREGFDVVGHAPVIELLRSLRSEPAPRAERGKRQRARVSDTGIEIASGITTEPLVVPAK
jgi:DNA-binding transcriptional LysR family regulator